MAVTRPCGGPLAAARYVPLRRTLTRAPLGGISSASRIGECQSSSRFYRLCLPDAWERGNHGACRFSGRQGSPPLGSVEETNCRVRIGSISPAGYDGLQVRFWSDYHYAYLIDTDHYSPRSTGA